MVNVALIENYIPPITLQHHYGNQLHDFSKNLFDKQKLSELSSTIKEFF